MARLARFLLCCSFLLLLQFAVAHGTLAQGRQAPTPPPAGSSGMSTDQGNNLLVSVRENTGIPLGLGAIVKLDSVAGAIHTTTSTRDGGAAMFSGIPPGDYYVEVNAAGYQTTTERIEVFGTGGAGYYTVYVYLQPESSGPTPHVPGNPMLMSPKLQAEIDKALDKMKKQQWDAARTHLEKAAKMAPANPDVQYLLGFLEYKQDHFDAARAKFQHAISINPAHEKSHVTLGELELRAGHPAEAVQSLLRAYQLNGADWRMHFLLAHAYAAQKQYEKAEPHAKRAVELGKTNVADAQLLQARILAGQAKKEEATRVFQALMRDFPNTIAAQDAKADLAALERPVVVPVAAKESAPGPSASSGATTSVLLPELPATRTPAVPAVAHAWAPPDIDAKEYPIASDVACSQDDIIHRAALRSARQLGNFERFMATEHIVHQEVDAKGNHSAPKSRDFTYLVFIEHGKDGTVFLEEERDGGQNLTEFPSHLASTGLVSLGVAVFREDMQKDFTYRCEGLGKWRGQPTWQIRFEQRKEAPSRLRTWRNSRGTFRIPLKGRVWVSANTYDVLHLETDLREAQEVLALDRDHLIVDYGPVKFEHAKTSLWLPWYAELFIELRGKRYHHRHTLTNYALFSVDTTNTISVPDAN